MIALLRIAQCTHPIGRPKARRSLHQGKFDNRRDIVFDDYAGRLTARVTNNLDSGRGGCIASNAGKAQRNAVGRVENRRLVPEAPDAPNVHRMIGRGRIEIVPVRHAPFGETLRNIQIKRRCAHRHGHDPLAGRPARGQASDPLLDLPDRAARLERRIEKLEPFAIHVRMRIDNAGHDGRALQIYPASLPTAQ